MKSTTTFPHGQNAGRMVGLPTSLLGLFLARAAATAEASCQDTWEDVPGESCSSWAAAGECEANAAFMLAECQLSCGCKVAPPAPEGPACEDRDKSGSCASWMASGECEANPSFMKLKCAASCGTCDMLDYKKRCPAPTAEPSVPPGAMVRV